MKRTIGDFRDLFTKIWLVDFPVNYVDRDFARRADWTIHIGMVVRRTADILGYFTHFEDGKRTDAIVRRSDQSAFCNLEWEWMQPAKNNIPEIQQLMDFPDEVDFSVFIGYSQDERKRENENYLTEIWTSPRPLLAYFIDFTWDKKHRLFNHLESFVVQNGKATGHSTSAALPWQIEGSRWEHLAS